MSSHPTHPSVLIRAARGSDDGALVDLAGLDSAPALTGPALVAEVDGRIVAALATDSGARIADPFVSTSSILDLLALRARPAVPRRRVTWTRPLARVA